MDTTENQPVHKNRSVLILLAFVGLVSMSCAILSTRTTKNDQNIQKAASTEKALFKEPISTIVPVDETVDDVEIHYVYTSGFVTALYHLYGSVLDDFVDITLTNNGKDELTFVVQTEVDGYTVRSSDTVDVPAGESLEVHQNPRLLEGAVDQLNSEKQGTFRITVVKLEDGKEILLLDNTDEILIYSRRDWVWIDGFEWQEEYELWAAWVTPTDPKVEELIRVAADYTKTGIMKSGYGGVDDEDSSVWDRLQAIWRAEQEQYHLTYISTMTVFGPNAVQRIRLPAEVLDQASGNCIELAILFASTAEALGLEAAIIRIPGHAYVAIRMDTETAHYYFVETTMIGQFNFDEARKFGSDEWDEAKPHFDAGEDGYGWVNLPEAREKGILPIPWK